jgi:hypothetical protein
MNILINLGKRLLEKNPWPLFGKKESDLHWIMSLTQTRENDNFAVFGNEA